MRIHPAASIQLWTHGHAITRTSNASVGRDGESGRSGHSPRVITSFFPLGRSAEVGCAVGS